MTIQAARTVEKKVSSGYVFAVQRFDAAKLRDVLLAVSGYLYVPDYMPFHEIAWRKGTGVFSGKSPLCESLVRNLRVDLQMPVSSVVQNIDKLPNLCGLMFVMDRLVPNTLIARELPEDSLNTIMEKNGLVLKIDYPHPGETAVIYTPCRSVKGVLEQGLS